MQRENQQTYFGTPATTVSSAGAASLRNRLARSSSTRATSSRLPPWSPFFVPACCCRSTPATGFRPAGHGPTSNTGIACAAPSRPTCCCIPGRNSVSSGPRACCRVFRRAMNSCWQSARAARPVMCRMPTHSTAEPAQAAKYHWARKGARARILDVDGFPAKPNTGRWHPVSIRQRNFGTLLPA